jgi:hypothetical protein
MLPAPADQPCHCPLCESGDDGTNPRARVVEHVREFGWHAAGVLADDRVPGWGYSVGLWHSYRIPEVSVFGLPADTCMAIVNVVGRMARDGTALAAEQWLDGVVDGFPVALREVRGEWFPDLFGQATGFYRRPPLPMLQICWPDREGRFPWDPGVQEACRRSQPLLWLSIDEHPAGVWTGLRDEPAWPFGAVPPDRIVFTTARIVAGETTVTGVVHDHDGDWQFLDGEPTTVEDGAVVHLQHVVSAHPHVAEVADLQPGERAWRRPDGSWDRTT